MTMSTGDDVLGDVDDYGLQTSDDFVLFPLQGAIQIDGLAHVSYRDTLYNGYRADLTTARSGARRLGIHHLDGAESSGVPCWRTSRTTWASTPTPASSSQR